MTKNVLKRNRNRLRLLVCESLESRQLMAADMVHHNFMMPEDSDMSGSVTPLDVLTVINRLNSQGASSQDEFNAAVDVDGDGALSPLDALNVINFVNRSAGENVLQVSQVSIQNRIERLEEAMDSELLPPNIDLVMATQIRDILRAGGFPEVGDRMVDGVLNRMLPDSSFLGQDSVQPTMDELPELPNDDNDFDYSQFPIISEVNDPTNDNGNGSFMDTQTAAPTLSFIEIELRKQLKVD
ncbi:MAG: dockerin type I domain-containing protein, partial [Pirellula sp.]